MNCEFNIGDEVIVVTTRLDNWYKVGEVFTISSINDCKYCDQPHATVEEEDKSCCVLLKDIELYK